MTYPHGAHAASLQRPAAPSPPADEPAAARVDRLAPAEWAPAPPRARPRRWGRAIAILVGVLLGGLAAWLLLGALGTKHPAATPGDRVVDVGAVSVTVPADWLPTQDPGRVVGDLGSPTAVLDPYPGIRLHAVVVDSPGGIPPALTDLVGPLGTGRDTQLAGRPARAYAGRPVRGNRIAELTVARSSAGTLIVACIGPTSSWAVATGCADSVGPGPASN